MDKEGINAEGGEEMTDEWTKLEKSWHNIKTTNRNQNEFMNNTNRLLEIKAKNNIK